MRSKLQIGLTMLSMEWSAQIVIYEIYQIEICVFLDSGKSCFYVLVLISAILSGKNTSIEPLIRLGIGRAGNN